MDSYRQPPHVAIDGDHVMEIISETYATESDTMNEDNAENDESPCKQYYDACDGHRINVTVIKTIDGSKRTKRQCKSLCNGRPNTWNAMPKTAISVNKWRRGFGTNGGHIWWI
eukprot:209387_1